ncbi:glycosyl transferase family 25, partial [Pseudoalteromonas sp. S554]
EIAKSNSGRNSNKSTIIINLKHRLNLLMQRKKISHNQSMITRKL